MEPDVMGSPRPSRRVVEHLPIRSVGQLMIYSGHGFGRHTTRAERRSTGARPRL
ncbi:MAG: hypothetical protein ACRDRH_22125 [Pseudonocardia sp.]